jgi:hypothetical protein
MLLSGSVGFTLLFNKNINKAVLLLADVHDGVSYCKRDSVMIDKWLSLKSMNNDILLEEAVREELSLTDLWPGAEHTQRLKKLNKENQKIKPVDIRPLLIPYSWELLDSIDKPELKNTTLDKYLQNIDDFYNLKKTKFMIKYIVPEIKKLYKTTDENIKRILFLHFEEMKKYYMDYRNNNKECLDKPLYDVYVSNKDILEDINNMSTMIMEWYILLLIFNSKTNNILHLGLAHSNRLLDFLKEIYKFVTIKKSGINEIAEITNEQPEACLLVPEDINNIK